MFAITVNEGMAFYHPVFPSPDGISLKLVAQYLYYNQKAILMPDKQHPHTPPDIPVPGKKPEISPDSTPEMPNVPDNTPETIPQERPVNNPPEEIPLSPDNSRER